MFKKILITNLKNFCDKINICDLNLKVIKEKKAKE